MTLAYVALGANIGDPAAQLNLAVAALDALPATRVLAVSPYYRSAPVGYTDQPDFTNAALSLETALDAEALLQALLQIEANLGRQRTFRNAPRPLDLDLLLFGDEAREQPHLTLPHPRMHERAFVLLPLSDIAPDLAVPGHGSVASLLSALDRSDLQRL